jgi:hypothetical protein
MQVQEEMVRRANLQAGKSGKRRVYSSKYALSSIVYCGECGDIYRRVHWNNRGCKSIVWRCVSRLEEKGSDCSSRTINEATLQEAVVKAINEVLGSKDTFLTVLQENIAAVLNEDNDQTIQEIEIRLNELQQELLQLVNAKADYQKVADEIYRLRELKHNILAENAEREGKRERIADMTEFLNEQSHELEEYDEQLVRRLIEKITIYDEKLTIEFKSSVEIDVEV